MLHVYLCVSARMHESAHLVHLFIQALCLFTDGKKLQSEDTSSRLLIITFRNENFCPPWFFYSGSFSRTSFVRVLNLIDFLLALTLFLLFAWASCSNLSFVTNCLYMDFSIPVIIRILKYPVLLLVHANIITVSRNLVSLPVELWTKMRYGGKYSAYPGHRCAASANRHYQQNKHAVQHAMSNCKNCSFPWWRPVTAAQFHPLLPCFVFLIFVVALFSRCSKWGR